MHARTPSPDAPAPLAEIDLADPGLYSSGDPPAVFRLLRREEPLFWNRGATTQGFWAVMRYHDALGVFRDPRTFTSERGMQVGQDDAAVRAAAGKMVIVTDGPRHAALRALMLPRLTANASRALEPLMRTAVTGSLRAFRDSETFDFAQLAGRVPLLVTSAVLGVPEADREMVALLTRTAVGWSQTAEPVPPEDRAAANADLFVYYDELLRERRRAPGDDLVSDLARASDGGEQLASDVVQLNIQALVNGGNETTRHAACGGVIALAENPRAWRRLKREPSLVPLAVEEILRWTSPTLHQMRTATRDAVVAGVRVAAGERIAVWNASANRDEVVFENPETFDVGRTPNRHLAFGGGPHVCIGAAIARTELRVIFEELVRHVAAVELAGPPKRLHSTLMWGYDRVPLRFRLEPAAAG